MHKIFDILTGKCIRNITFPHAPKNAVYLTFDDGPDNECTPLVLDVLKRHQIKATFFIIGNKALAQTNILTRVTSEGHAVGNHTMDHNTKRYFSNTECIKSWLVASEELLSRDLKLTSVGFRSPVGIKTPALNAVLKILGWPLILWEVRFYDMNYGLSVSAVKKKLPSIHSGSIILLHDTHRGIKQKDFLEGLEYLIIELKARRFEFLPLSKQIVTEAYKHKYQR